MMDLCEVKLKSGRVVDISDITMCPAEPDVGIMSVYPDGYTVVLTGTDKEIELTVAEDDEVCDKIAEAYRDWQADAGDDE